MPKEKKEKRQKQRWYSEFKEFAMRGNVIDLAVGVIIGGAFGKIISSLVDDVFMPIIGMFFGGVKFDSLVIILPPNLTPTGSEEPLTLKLGSFIGTVVDFILIALCVFFMIKVINSTHRKNIEEPSKPDEPSPDIALLTEIRDLLKREENP
ncbi:MAG: large-conductance mechanosensitive channel protein MscL [Oscillospiraceae bacterium]|nr:large-conductance mechanosensitive channel protein MscL [Oscillospiraceae bacterium]